MIVEHDMQLWDFTLSQHWHNADTSLGHNWANTSNSENHTYFTKKFLYIYILIKKIKY